MKGRKVYTFGDISGFDPVNDRIPILDMNQSGEARDKLISPGALLSGIDLGLYSTIVYTTGISGVLQAQITSIQSGTGIFYPSSNPSGYITGQDLSSYATILYVTGVSGELQSDINALNLITGDFLLSSQSGLFYPSNNPSGFISGVDLSPYATIVYVTGISGSLQSEVDILNGLTGNFVLDSETGLFYPSSNPSGFTSGQDLSNYSTIPYVTGASGYLQGQVTNLNNNTGNYYINSNPSGFITGDLSLYGTLVYINSVSGNLQSQIPSSIPDGRSLLNLYWK